MAQTLSPNPNGKIRGVNMGSLFLFETWIAENAWSDIGRDGQQSEFDCVSSIGQNAANSVFAKHWESWDHPGGHR